MRTPGWSAGLATAAWLVLPIYFAKADIVVYDGSGSPADEGFTEGGGSSLFTLDSDDGTPGSAPGFLHQAAAGGSGSDNFWDLTPNLDDAQGWFVETRFDVVSNDDVDDGLGATFWVQSAIGRYLISLRENDIFVGGSSVGYPGAGPFHTLRVEMPAGSPNPPEIILDGVSQGTFGVGGAGNRLSFGDHSAGAAEVVWDYVVMNQEIPEPGGVALLVLGALLLRRRHRAR